MRVVGHGAADDSGDLLVATVVVFEKGMQNAALDRLEAVFEVRHGAVEDDVARVVEEPAIVEPFKMIYVGKSKSSIWRVRIHGGKCRKKIEILSLFSAQMVKCGAKWM